MLPWPSVIRVLRRFYIFVVLFTLNVNVDVDPSVCTHSPMGSLCSMSSSLPMPSNSRLAHEAAASREACSFVQLTRLASTKMSMAPRRVATMSPNVTSSEHDDAAALVDRIVSVDLRGMGANITEHGSTAAAVTGITLNAVGDLAAFCSGLAMSAVIIVFCVLGFHILRKWYPIIYENNAIQGWSPVEIPPGAVGWAQATVTATLDDYIRSVGLDNAMLIEFTVLGMKIMAIIGIPMNLLMGPLHFLYGGNAANDKKLSYWSMGNVANGS